MLLCDNCNGGYHLFCIKPELIQIFVGIWYCSSCSLATPWFLHRPWYVFLGSGLGGDTWEFHLNLLLCIVYICACISFWLISLYFWLVLVFLFNRVYYGFTPLRHRASRHYTSWHYSQILLNLVVDIIVSLATSQNWKSKPWDSPHVWKIIDPQKVFECWKYKSNNAFFCLFPMVLIMFPWGSSSSWLVLENIPNSTSFLSHMVCPKFNSHVYKLRRYAIGGIHLFLFCN